MEFTMRDKGISCIEVSNISRHGLWLCTRDSELFISFKEFPQFLDASVSKILRVEQQNPNFLHWPDLGIDLAVDSIRCFPLLSKPSRPTTHSSRQAKTEPITQSKSNLRLAPIRTSPKNNA
ncbi:MAG: DUF2442 domain-containing protein [Nitrospira sp. CG24B]|nr:MAG: DUF2442 domain-containing protein [Nitrospira sp. CG24B]